MVIFRKQYCLSWTHMWHVWWLQMSSQLVVLEKPSHFMIVCTKNRCGSVEFLQQKTFLCTHITLFSWCAFINIVFRPCYLFLLWNVVLKYLALCLITIIAAYFLHLYACLTCSSVHASSLHPLLARHHLCYVDVYCIFFLFLIHATFFCDSILDCLWLNVGENCMELFASAVLHVL